MKILEIYTDGGCAPNPGFGACAFVVVDGKQAIYSQKYKKPDTTNNVMELSAVISALMWALEHIKKNPRIRFYVNTDSQYVQLGVSKWMNGWKKRNWKTSNKKPVKNKELWQRLDVLLRNLDVQFQWVRGHNGNKWNEMADRLCSEVLTQYQNQWKT